MSMAVRGRTLPDTPRISICLSASSHDALRGVRRIVLSDFAYSP